MNTQIEFLIETGLKMGITIPVKSAETLLKFKELVLNMNKRMNITAITDSEGFLIKHILDSLTVLKFADLKPDFNVLDLGSGGGFPGIPLKIMLQDINLTMLDSQNKKVNFLNSIITDLKLTKTSAIHARAEEAGQNLDYRENFDYVVSRAVASLSVLLEYCLPFVKLNGYFMALKGPNAAQELDQSKGITNLLGAEFVSMNEIVLPIINEQRVLLLYKKTKKTPLKYPRNSGIPAKNPLKK